MRVNKFDGLRSSLRAAAASGMLSAFLLISCAGAHGHDDGKIDPDVVAARALIDSWNGKSEDLNAAREKITKALNTSPRNVFALKEMARYQIKAGLLSYRPVKRNNIVIEAYFFQPGTLERAEETIRTAIRIDPKFAEGYILLSNIQYLQNKMEDATQSLRLAQELGTDDPWLHLNWAAIDQAKGDDRSAETHWRQVLQSKTKNKLAMSSATSFLLGSYVKSGDHQKAVALYEDMIKQDPGDAEFRGSFATYLSETLGRNDEAIVQARASLNVMDFGAGHRILATALCRKWVELLVKNPKDPVAGEYFLEAKGTSPDLGDVMVYGASMPGSEHLAKALVSKGVSIDSQATDGSTALLIATNTNRASAVKSLIDLKADPNIADSNGWTPLLSAADEGNTEIVDFLLKGGADVRATLGGRNASEMAAKKGYAELAKMLTAAETDRK